jgi:hypothetical protein
MVGDLVLITISGMAGSGKTTAAKHIMGLCEHAGIEAQYLRFRHLPCFSLRHWVTKRPDVSSLPSSQPAGQAARWTGYRSRSLTAPITVGYAARILAFRLWRSRHRSPGWEVSNRYFSDSLAHYQLASVAGRIYCRILRWLIPVPDVAILLVASERTISIRRPNYSAEYVSNVARGHRNLRIQFPELIEICTDGGHDGLAHLEAVIREQIGCRTTPKSAQQSS